MRVGNQGVNHASDEGNSLVASAFLTLGHVLAAIGAEHNPPIGLNDIRVIRHSFNTGEELGLRGPEDLTEDKRPGIHTVPRTSHPDSSLPSLSGTGWSGR